ncbi:MAG: tetratricopeptide repeat protein, partial [Anaerolineae bacterium]|nr:tetratricopeptide repeat protein [Anaerolineae bacterium]
MTIAGSPIDALQRVDEALADYDRAIDLNPEYAEAYNNRGNVYAALRRYDEALA